MPTEFRNEPLTDFSKEANAAAMRAAIEKVKSELGRDYPLVIGGERITTGDTLSSINPANRTQVVGSFHKATKELANRAVETAASSLRDLRVAEVTKMDMKVENGTVTAFRTRVALSFKYEG